jgi:hypothetical protein
MEKRKAGLKSPLRVKRFLNQGARDLFFENRLDDACDQESLPSIVPRKAALRG